MPMRGVPGELPYGDGWVYELKWDGMRILAHLGDGQVRLQSSNGRDVTGSFPELESLAELAEGFDSLVLDGEVVAFADGRPSFNALQHRMHVTDPHDAARRAKQVPVMFVVFDLLWLNEHDTRRLPLVNRRALLDQTIHNGAHWRICEQHDDDPEALLETVLSNDLEGIMAKRSASLYETGRRSQHWVKIKPRQRQEFVVGGWLSGRGTRTGGLGSLLVGYYDNDGHLRFAGRAGSGLTDATIRWWQGALQTQPECPFAEVPSITLEGRTIHWCKPELVAEIAFNEWADGHQLRHPVVLGHRSDKDPSTITRES